MKKSPKLWFTAALVSALAAIFLGVEELGFGQQVDPVYFYVALGLGFLATAPIWMISFGKARNIQFLVSLTGVILLYGAVLLSQTFENYWVPAAITAVLNLSAWALSFASRLVENSRRNLSGLLPKTASVIDGVEINHIDTSELQVGQVVLVRPGNVIPCDGYVIQGTSHVDQSAITGEENVLKIPGDWVLAGSSNQAGKSPNASPLTIRVATVDEDTLVRVLDRPTVMETQGPIHYRRLSVALSSTISILSVATALSVAGFLIIGGNSYDRAAIIASTILLSAQVALLTQSLPMIGAVTAIRSRALGFVIRSREAFEKLAEANHVVFIKTGILTNGHKKVGKIHLARNTSIGTEDELLALAAAVEMGTSHELGHLIIEEAVRRGLELPVVSDITTIPGLGVSARFDGSLVQVGNAGMVNVTGVSMNPYDLFMVSSAYSELSSVVFVSVDELLVGYIEFPDSIRENSSPAIVAASGKHAITVLSGDATALVEKLATTLGLSDFAAEVLSTRKADWIRQRKASGSKILLVGDGQYDAEALAEADVSIAFGAGHDIHQASSEIVQISQDPLASSKILDLARSSRSALLWSVIAGTGLSLGLMSLAVLGFHPVAVVASGAMITALVALNISRLGK